MPFDFDTVICRKNTQCMKYDTKQEHDIPKNALPLWIADMDFASPPCVLEALQKRVEHGVLGYSCIGTEYYTAIKNWMKKRHDWVIEDDWIVTTPGVVFAIRTAIHAFTTAGDSVLIQPPVYPPFAASTIGLDRNLVLNPLIYEDGSYRIDFEDFERKIIEHKVKLFVLCSPHNPIGRVWTKEELTRLADICLAHNVLIVSDEIHQDFVFPGQNHHVLTTVKDDYRKNTIVCTAPSKTFNIAGLQTSNIIIEDPVLRAAFSAVVSSMGYGEPNVMGLLACQAAYAGGEAWLEALNDYLWGNVEYVRHFFQQHLPMLHFANPEGTYLLWIDFSGLEMTSEALDNFLRCDAGLWLSPGTDYGPGGESFQRLNIGAPRRTLEQAMQRLKHAIDSL